MGLSLTFTLCLRLAVGVSSALREHTIGFPGCGPSLSSSGTELWHGFGVSGVLMFLRTRGPFSQTPRTGESGSLMWKVREDRHAVTLVSASGAYVSHQLV